MSTLNHKCFLVPVSLLVICLFFHGCVPSQQPVSGAADVDSTAAACAFIARELDRKSSVDGLKITITEENILERQSKILLPYSKILSDGLTRELSNLGAIVSVRENSAHPLVLYVSYAAAKSTMIIDVKLRQIDYDRGTTQERAVAEAAIPIRSIASHWLQPTLSSLSDSLVRQLSTNYVSGNFFKLKIVKSIPGTAGQPSLVLGRKFDGILQEAVSRTQLLPISITSHREILLRSSYIITTNSIQFKAWLENKNGKQLATAITTMDRSNLSADLFTPMANKTTTVCIRHKRVNNHDKPAESAEAKQLRSSIRKYLQELGIQSQSCSSSLSQPQIVTTVTIPPFTTTRDGYKLSTATIYVEILDNQGRQLGHFNNQASRGFSGNQTNANNRAIDKAANLELKEKLARSLLSVSP